MLNGVTILEVNWGDVVVDAADQLISQDAFILQFDFNRLCRYLFGPLQTIHSQEELSAAYHALGLKKNVFTPNDRVFRVDWDIFSRWGILYLVATSYFYERIYSLAAIELKRVSLLYVDMDHVVAAFHSSHNPTKSLI